MPDFKSIKELNAYLMPKINHALENEVLDMVKQVEHDAINATVYVYESSGLYDRRGGDQGSGGIGDIDNIIQDDAVENGILSVINITQPNPGGVPLQYQAQVTTNKNLPELIEYGSGYKGYKYDFVTLDGRPFIEETIRLLETYNDHIWALERGLKEQGVRVE